MKYDIFGYRRNDGSIGIRNHVAVIAAMDNAIPTVRRICDIVHGTVPVCFGAGRGLMGIDAVIHERMIMNTATHPNVYGVIIVSLEEKTAKRLAEAIQQRGRPAVGLSIEDNGGSLHTAAMGASAAIRMMHEAGRMRRSRMDWSEFVLGVECGGSDGSSGIVSNPVAGLLADRLIDAGGTVIMSETLELLGGEDMLAERAVDEQTATDVRRIVHDCLDYAETFNLDLMDANPAPDNIAGGLSTIEEKALGAIKKGGSRPLVEVVGLGERPERKGFVIMDAPCPAVENLSSLVAGGCHCIVFSTGRGNVSGNPISPVIKLSGNPDTVALLRDNIDVDVSGVITQGLPMAAAADELESFLSDVCYGAKTAADMLAEHEVAVSRFMRML